MRRLAVAALLCSSAAFEATLALGVTSNDIHQEHRSTMEEGKKRFPEHWGNPPPIQTKDLRPLPDGYGRGSSTLKHWIQQKMAEDAKASSTPVDSTNKWPDLNCVGMAGEDAQKRVIEADPNLNVIVLPEGSPVTEDYRMDRVRIFVDDRGRVTRQPVFG